jgi:hypothetical protein
VRAWDVIDCVALEELDAVAVLNEGRPDGIIVSNRKLVL